jgi:hypothetical protein
VPRSRANRTPFVHGQFLFWAASPPPAGIMPLNHPPALGEISLGIRPWLPDPPGWSSTWACGRPMGSKIARNGRSSSESARRSTSDKQERNKSVQALKNLRKESRSRAGPRRNAPPELVQSESAASGIQDQEHFGRAGLRGYQRIKSRENRLTISSPSARIHIQLTDRLSRHR